MAMEVSQIPSVLYLKGRSIGFPGGLNAGHVREKIR